MENPNQTESESDIYQVSIYLSVVSRYLLLPMLHVRCTSIYRLLAYTFRSLTYLSVLGHCRPASRQQRHPGLPYPPFPAHYPVSRQQDDHTKFGQDPGSHHCWLQLKGILLFQGY